MRGTREILFEFKRIGNTVKVTAVDPQSGTEVAIVGPATAGESELRRAAANKLNYVLAKHPQR